MQHCMWMEEFVVLFCMCRPFHSSGTGCGWVTLSPFGLGLGWADPFNIVVMPENDNVYIVVF